MQGERLSHGLSSEAALLLLVLVIGFVTYFSVYPTYRLRVDMPAEFLDAPASLSPEKRAAEEKVARAYWYCVVTVIQRTYNFGQPLPLSPPAEFKTAGNLPATAQDPGTRFRYWHRLQSIWYLGSIWNKQRIQDFRWVTGPTQSGWLWVRHYMGRFVGA
jgi:hypothetical protein